MWVFTIEATFFIISIASGYLIAYLMPGQDTFLAGTLLSLCFYSTVQYFKFASNFRFIKLHNKNLTQTLKNIESRSILRSSVIDKIMSAFEIQDSLIRESVLRGIKDFSRSISTQEDGVVLQGDELALKTYEAFWIQLIEEQKKRKSQGLSALIVRVTHSTSISIWRTRGANSLLEHQRNFVKFGGYIVRILIRPNERKEPIIDYRTAAEWMRNAGIKVFMLELDDEGFQTFDYLLVGNLRYILIWNSDVVGRNITGCEIFRSDDRYNNLIGDWRRVVADLQLQRKSKNLSDDDVWKYELNDDAWELLNPSRD